jgi:hypothetical protein
MVTRITFLRNATIIKASVLTFLAASISTCQDTIASSTTDYYSRWLADKGAAWIAAAERGGMTSRGLLKEGRVFPAEIVPHVVRSEAIAKHGILGGYAGSIGGQPSFDRSGIQRQL